MQNTAALRQPLGHPKYAESDRLAARITELHAYITAATAAFLALVREFDGKGYWELPGVNSCAHWLNWQCGIGMNAAREKVRVARALGGLPKIDAAFARGEVSYSKVRAMTRAAKPSNEGYLLNIANEGTAYHTERLIAHYRRVNRLREAEAAEHVHQNREVVTRWGADGSLVLNARLPAEQGALVLKALEHFMERQFEASTTMTAANDDGNSSDGVSAETPREREPTSARRADALAEMAETCLATASLAGSAGDRYQVVVHVSAETLTSRDADVNKTGRVSAETPASAIPEIAGIEHGPRVAAETSRRIACDSSVVRLIKDENGEPLSIGRKSRSIPPAIRRALQVRDHSCRFPGCTNTRFVDGHHVRHWADGGETSLDNLVLLCRRHHRLVHEGGFGCARERGEIVFRSPTGNVLPSCPRPVSVDNEDPVAWIAKHIPCDHITSKTGVTRWSGERIDWDLAVSHLFPVNDE